MTDLIARLEGAAEATQYDLMREAVNALFLDTEGLATVKFVNLFGVIQTAQSLGAPALLLGVAAMMVPESDAGFLTFWRLGNDGEGADPGAFRAEVYQTSADDHRRAVSISAVPACALAAACLKSRSVSEGKS